MKILMQQRMNDGDIGLYFRHRRPVMEIGVWAVVNNSLIKDYGTVRATYAVTHIPTGMKACDVKKARVGKKIVMDIVTDAGVMPCPEIPSEVVSDPEWMYRGNNWLYRDELRDWANTYVYPVIKKWLDHPEVI